MRRSCARPSSSRARRSSERPLSGHTRPRAPAWGRNVCRMCHHHAYNGLPHFKGPLPPSAPAGSRHASCGTAYYRGLYSQPPLGETRREQACLSAGTGARSSRHCGMPPRRADVNGAPSLKPFGSSRALLRAAFGSTPLGGGIRQPPQRGARRFAASSPSRGLRISPLVLAMAASAVTRSEGGGGRQRTACDRPAMAARERRSAPRPGVAPNQVGAPVPRHGFRPACTPFAFLLHHATGRPAIIGWATGDAAHREENGGLFRAPIPHAPDGLCPVGPRRCGGGLGVRQAIRRAALHRAVQPLRRELRRVPRPARRAWRGGAAVSEAEGGEGHAPRAARRRGRAPAP